MVDDMGDLDKVIGKLMLSGFVIKTASCDKNLSQCSVNFYHPKAETYISTIIYDLSKGEYQIFLRKDLDLKKQPLDLNFYIYTRTSTSTSMSIGMSMSIDMRNGYLELFIGKITHPTTVVDIIKSFYRSELESSENEKNKNKES